MEHDREQEILGKGVSVCIYYGYFKVKLAFILKLVGCKWYSLGYIVLKVTVRGLAFLGWNHLCSPSLGRIGPKVKVMVSVVKIRYKFGLI